MTGTFAVQMVVRWGGRRRRRRRGLQAIRRLPLPSEGLYPVRTTAISVTLYGPATVAGGSGFLAVSIAGILLGDSRAPFKRAIEGFHPSLAGLAESVPFVVLGLTVSLHDIRPEGAVPILLGTYIPAGGTRPDRLAYDVIFVVVTFSVVDGQVVMMVAIPFAGALSDRIGRKPCWWISLIDIFVLAIPMFLLMTQGLVPAIIGFTVLGLVYVLQLGTLSATFPAMFPTHVRYSGMAISYNVATAAFGGTALAVNETALIGVTDRPGRHRFRAAEGLDE